ncbi:hypothetical protein BVE25_004746, partial [Salmonella enterica subsp. enterica]|nr:hypothetical protein [Salmonella enterica subsp. enterica]
TPITGIPSTGYADTLTGGADTEEPETWRARVMERYYWIPQGALILITSSGQRKSQE